jgi:O-antigen ligase
MLLALIGAARISTTLFVAIALLSLGVVGLLAWRWPRAALVGVVLGPILDRYLISLALPPDLRATTTYLSEALLAVVAVAIVIRGARSGTLRHAVNHPVIWALAAFSAVAAASGILNGVPVEVAAAGVIFTLEAAALFLLARVVPFDRRQAAAAALAFVAVVVLAALLAMGQVLLHPNFLGLEAFSGRFGEGQRVASFLVNPNMLGVMLAMALPFTLLAGLTTDGARRNAAWGLALLLSLALLYTFSRGAWFSLAVATLLIGLTVERRVLPAVLLLGVLTFGIAAVLPRHLFYADRDQEPFDLIAATFGRLESLGEGDLRVQFVENALPIVADHPLIGAGPGRYGGAIARDVGSPLYERYTAGTVPIGRTVDNFWLHLLVEVGVIGLTLFATAIGLAVAVALRAARAVTGLPRVVLAGSAALAVVVGVDSVTEMLLEGNTTSFAVWCFLGIATGLGSAGARLTGKQGLSTPRAR